MGSEMVERVARVLFPDLFLPPIPGRDEGPLSPTAFRRAVAFLKARAAIEAMKDPPGFSSFMGSETESVWLFNAMIDKALEE